MRLPTGPVGLLRRGRTASTGVANAWQAMADEAGARAQRERLAPGRSWEDPEGRLDALPAVECWNLLRAIRLGRIGFTAHSGQPVIVPVNFSVVDRRVLIRSGRGPKLEAARRGDLVAFEADRIDLERHTGWSVTLSGRARWAREASERAALEAKLPAAWVAGPRDELIVIDPLHIGGRRIDFPRSLGG